MPITLITGPANAGKARAVLDALRADAAGALSGPSPLLVVPTAADAERYRTELSQSGPMLGVSVMLFSGLIERVVACAAAAEPRLGAPPLGEQARRRMLCTLTADLAPGLAEAEGWGEALARTVGALELAGTSPAKLAAAGVDVALAAVYEAYRSRLQAIGRFDAELRQRRALDALRREPALWSGAPVFLYGFDDLTALQLDAIETLGRVVSAAVTVSLSYEGGRTAFGGRAWAFQELLPLAARHVSLPPRSEHYEQDARAALHGLERGIFEVERGVVEAGQGIAAAVVTRGAVAEDGGAEDGGAEDGGAEDGGAEDGGAEDGGAEDGGAEDGGELRLFALDLLDGDQASTSVRRTLDPGDAVRLLEGGSERAEHELIADEVRLLIEAGLEPEQIAIVHRAPASVAEHMGEALAAAGVPHACEVALRFADTSLGGALIGLLRCGCEGEEGVTAATLSDLLAWLRAPGVLRRAELADRLERHALRAGAAGAAAARQLWELDHWRLEQIDWVADAAAKGPLALIDRAERDAIWLFAARRRQRAEVLEGEAEPQALALRCILSALAELRELVLADDRLLGGAPGLIDALRSLRLAGRTGARDGAVALLHPLTLRARRVKALFLCGLQEGVFPALRESEPILAERRLQEALGPVRGRPTGPEHALASERYLLYATLSRPEARLFLSWHESSDDGQATPRSLFLDDVLDLFGERLWQQRRRRGAGAIEPPASGRVRAELFSDGSGRSLAARVGADEVEPGNRLVVAHAGADEAEPNGRRPAARSSSFDRSLHDERVLSALRERSTWSASSLERWAACPVSWFVERLLAVEKLEPDAEALARGSFAHDVLSDVYEGLKERCGSAQITSAKLPLARELAAQSLRARAVEHPLSVAPERLRAATRRLEADLERYLESAAEQESPLEPTYFELGFGFDEQEGGVPPLQLGGDLRLRGRIDRIDVGEHGEAVVYDYKSGRVGGERSAPKWLEGSRFQMALYMRVAAELLGLDPVGGLYQPLSGELRPRGAMRLDASGELSHVRTDGLDADELHELLTDVSAAAVAAAQEARAGALQARPDTCAYRGGCMYPTICRCGR